jgi:hypothetical protein
MIAIGLITFIIGAGFLEGTLPGIGFLLACTGLFMTAVGAAMANGV